MQKLRDTIAQHGQWAAIEAYLSRIETFQESDFSQAVENAKALLEAIGREICDKKGTELKNNISVSALLKKAVYSLGYPSTALENQIAAAMATIAQQMGNLRNEIGSTAHGKTIDQLNTRNDAVDLLTREFLLDTVEIVGCFLIRNFEQGNPRSAAIAQKPTLEYTHHEDFNQNWDESFGDFAMGDYSFTASEVLFNVDPKAYETELQLYGSEEENPLNAENIPD